MFCAIDCSFLKLDFFKLNYPFKRQQPLLESDVLFSIPYGLPLYFELIVFISTSTMAFWRALLRCPGLYKDLRACPGATVAQRSEATFMSLSKASLPSLQLSDRFELRALPLLFLPSDSGRLLSIEAYRLGRGKREVKDAVSLESPLKANYPYINTENGWKCKLLKAVGVRE